MSDFRYLFGMSKTCSTNAVSSYMRQVTQWQWHLDEVFVKINGVQHYLWCAVDHEGEVLESFVTKNRDKGGALSHCCGLLR